MKKIDYYQQSLDLLQAQFLTFIRPADISEELLDAWIVEPSRQSDTTPYRVFLRAHEIHDQFLNQPSKRIKTTADFLRFQYLLQVIREARRENVECPAINVFAFYQYDFTVREADKFVATYLPDTNLPRP